MLPFFCFCDSKAASCSQGELGIKWKLSPGRLGSADRQQVDGQADWLLEPLGAVKSTSQGGAGRVTF